MSRTVKTLIILAILGLSAYYLAILYLAAHPKVSYAYRMYYLEFKTRFWNRNQTLAYIPGTKFEMTIDRAWILSREGWSLPKDDLTGTEFSGKGGLYFTLHRVPENFRLEANILTLKPDTKMTFSIGNEWKTEINIKDAGGHQILIPLPVKLLKADPIDANYIAMTGSSPVRFQAMQMNRFANQANGKNGQ